MAASMAQDTINLPHSFYVGTSVNSATSPWTIVNEGQLIDLKNYPLGTECFYVLLNFGRLENGLPLKVQFTFRKDSTGEVLFTYSYEIPTPASQGWGWWNWYSTVAFIGHFAHEINEAGFYSCTVNVFDANSDYGNAIVKLEVTDTEDQAEEPEPATGIWAGAVKAISNAATATLNNLGKTIGGLGKAAAASIGNMVHTVETQITQSFSNTVNRHLGQISDGMDSQTLPDDVESTARRILETTQKRIEDEIGKEASSPLLPENSLAVVSKIGTATLGAASLGLTLATAADQAHPIKNIGFADLIKTGLGFMGVNQLIAPMITIPHDIGVLQPYRYYMQSVHKPFIPGMSDAVRFAVREAHRPELQAGTTADFIKHASLLGFSDKWAKYYWAAHWIIPTYEQARQAFWRGILSADEFAKLREFADLAPEYNNIWQGLQYSMPGKIDVRWMYEWSAIDKPQMRELLLKDGIDPEWVDAIADAYADNQLRDEKGRIRTQLVTQFKEGYITESILHDQLIALGFRPESVELSVVEAGLKRTKDSLDDYVKFYSAQLQKHAITPEEFEVALRELNILEDVIQLKKDFIVLKYPIKTEG